MDILPMDFTAVTLFSCLYLSFPISCRISCVELVNTRVASIEANTIMSNNNVYRLQCYVYHPIQALSCKSQGRISEFLNNVHHEKEDLLRLEAQKQWMLL